MRLQNWITLLDREIQSISQLDCDTETAAGIKYVTNHVEFVPGTKIESLGKETSATSGLTELTLFELLTFATMPSQTNTCTL